MMMMMMMMMMLWCGVFRGDADDSRQATVDWSWGTVRYRLGSTDDDEGDDDDEHGEPVSSPQPPDVQPPSHATELQVGHVKLSQTLSVCQVLVVLMVDAAASDTDAVVLALVVHVVCCSCHCL